MHTIDARNAHQALPRGLAYVRQFGDVRGSRNGKVFVSRVPVTTVYKRPMERLVFWPQRDVNTAFLLYEALWMLAGRNDLHPLTRYIKDFGRYSDDGLTLHGAYGHRWRKAFGGDQLTVIAQRLADDPEDRRCVLQMWDATRDLGRAGRDVPCNDMATFQRNANGELDMVVFNRSNDIIWGAYFANAVHFSMLQEYLACWIGCEVGSYWQVSVNYHAYESEYARVDTLPELALGRIYSVPAQIEDPYASGRVRVMPMAACGTGPSAIERINVSITEALYHADMGFIWPRESNDDDPWYNAVWAVLRAHERHTTCPAPERYTQALAILAAQDQSIDWIASMTAWVLRREAAWKERQSREAV